MQSFADIEYLLKSGYMVATLPVRELTKETWRRCRATFRTEFDSGQCYTFLSSNDLVWYVGWTFKSVANEAIVRHRSTFAMLCTCRFLAAPVDGADYKCSEDHR
jgi:hypothetical protein